MLLFLPLRPYEVATVVILVFMVVRVFEILLGSPCPPDTPLYHLSHEIEVVTSTHIVVQVVLANDWFYSSVLGIQDFVKLLEEFLIRLLHEVSLLESIVVNHTVDLRQWDIEKL